MISRISDTYAIRNGAMRFGAASQDFVQKANRLQGHMSHLLDGGNAWKGHSALAFSVLGGKAVEDVREAGLIFEKIGVTLNGLAAQLDLVNNLIQQSQSLQGEIDYLHHAINSTDDPHEQSSLRNELQYILNRRAALISEIEMIEYQANQNASKDFDDINDMITSLHFLGDKGLAVDGTVPFTGTSKHIGLYGSGLDLNDAYGRYKLGFGVERVETRSGRMALVQGGIVEDIHGTRYYFSNGRNYSNVLKYVDGKTTAIVSLRDIKGAGTIFGYASVAWETGDHLIENIQEDRSVAHTTAEATVDIGVGVASMAAVHGLAQRRGR